MPKNTYHCPCDRTFVKSFTAKTTGHRLTDYGPGHECFGCPFVLELMSGWDDNRKVVGYECRAQKLDPKNPEKSISYQTEAWYSFANCNTAVVYTLDLPWLMEFIRFYMGLPGASYLPEGEESLEELEQYYRGSGLDRGRRLYTFGFTKNKKGLAAKTELFQKFFDKNGIAKDTLGPEGDKEKILQQILIHQVIARKKAKEETVMAITYPISSATACSPDVAPPSDRTITDITAEIRFYKAQTVQSVIEIGKRLTEAKGMLEHGQWIDWLEGSVEISQRTAQRFMQLADTFPNASPVSHLSYSKLLALLAVPEEDREEFLEVPHNVDGEEKTVAEMSKRELERVIRERDKALKEQERLKMLADASDKMAEIRQKKLEEKGQELYEVKNHAAAEKLRYERELKRLESRPVEVAVQPPSEEELERIREEAREEGRQEMWEQQNASRGPGNSWLEGVLADKSEEYFQNTVKECVFVLIKAAALKPHKKAQGTLEKGISFLQEQIGELYRQCDLLLIHEQGNQEEDLDF